MRAPSSHLKRNLVFFGIAAISLITVVAVVYGFVFGLSGCFGGCGTIPHISTVSCSAASRGCQLGVVGGPNSDAGANIIACSFNVDNTTVKGNPSPLPSQNTVELPPGHTVTVYCLGYPGTPSAGGQVEGQIQASNGWVLAFSGTWA